MNQGTNPETPGWWPVYPESMFHGLSKHLRDVTEAYTFDTLTIRGHGTTVICLELRMVTVTVNTWCLTSQVTIHVTMLLMCFSEVHQYISAGWNLHPYSAKHLTVLSHLPVLFVKINCDLLSGLPMLSCFGPVSSHGKCKGKCAQFTKTGLLPGGYHSMLT